MSGLDGKFTVRIWGDFLMSKSVRTRIGRILNVLNLRNFARRLEKILMPERFRPADASTPLAVKKALRIAVENGLTSQGDYYEFGIYRGYTFWFAQKVMTELGDLSMRFIGVDSFSGLPELQEIDAYKGDFAKGQYSASFQYVRKMLNRGGVDWNRTILVPGYFKDTLTGDLKTKYDLRPAAVVLIDCDLYESTSEVLAFISDMLLDGSIVLFDDWNAFDQDDNHGERRAFREFLNVCPHWVASPLFEYGIFGQVFRMEKQPTTRSHNPIPTLTSAGIM